MCISQLTGPPGSVLLHDFVVANCTSSTGSCSYLSATGGESEDMAWLELYVNDAHNPSTGVFFTAATSTRHLYTGKGYFGCWANKLKHNILSQVSQTDLLNVKRLCTLPMKLHLSRKYVPEHRKLKKEVKDFEKTNKITCPSAASLKCCSCIYPGSKIYN